MNTLLYSYLIDEDDDVKSYLIDDENDDMITLVLVYFCEIIKYTFIDKWCYSGKRVISLIASHP